MVTIFTDADFLLRATPRMLDTPPLDEDAGGDHALDPTLAPAPGIRLRDAAVLIPVASDGGVLSVVLTRRHDALSSHAGQIAFPGGKLDAEDRNPIACALREAEEEIGLSPRQVTPLGYLPAYVTGTGYRVVPVLARVEGRFEPRPNAAEVAAVFEVPLAFLMNPANHRRASRVIGGVERHFYEMPFGPHYIWGATAGIIRSLYERIYA